VFVRLFTPSNGLWMPVLSSRLTIIWWC